MSVYKITDGELVYYGSTSQDIRRRLTTHKCPTNRCETRHFNKDNITIELVEEVEDAEQLLWRERYYVENNECVNKNLPILTNEEKENYYYLKHKEAKKAYQTKNKEKIKQQRATPYHCECGSVVRCDNKHHHFRTKKHINFINE